MKGMDSDRRLKSARIWFGGLWILLMMNAANAQEKKVFMVAGQSNAVGQGDASASVICNAGIAFEYKPQGLVPLSDPVGTAAGGFEHAASGSLCPAFAKAYNAITGRTVILVPAARGGSSCHQKAELNNYGTWARTGHRTLFDSAVQKAQAATGITNSALAGILWLQGERDANAINTGTLTVAGYRQALQDLLQRFRDKLGKNLPVYIVLTGYYTNHPTQGFDHVRQAQEDVACSDPYTYIVYRKTNLFPHKSWMKDDIHYNQTGLNDIGETIAEEIAAIEMQSNK